MNEVVREKEQQCFRDSADECVDLGNAAARIIAYDHCDSFAMAASGNTNWRQRCRDAAITQCRGQIFNEVRRMCGSPDTPTLQRLQNKCRNQVRSMIGDIGEEYSENYDSEDYDSEDFSEDFYFES